MRDTTADVPDAPPAASATHPLGPDDGLAFARTCIDAAGLRGRVEATHDPRARVLLVAGPDQFGLMGTTLYATVRVALPAAPRAIGLATARHVLGEFYASDDEIAARAAELPFGLAVLLAR